MDKLFDIVVAYPDSQPAVAELRLVLQTTNMHSQLGETLQASLRKRLIHPGANTCQIIDVYINTIKVCTICIINTESYIVAHMLAWFGLLLNKTL